MDNHPSEDHYLPMENRSTPSWQKITWEDLVSDGRASHKVIFDSPAQDAENPSCKNDKYDMDEDLPHRRAKSPAVASNLLFACPFAKFNSQRYSASNLQELHYRGCGQCYLSDISRVKQHLFRVHQRPQYYCPRCYTVFMTHRQRNFHIDSQVCESKECPFKEKMTHDQLSSIKKKRRPNEDSSRAWLDIFQTLFPDTPLPVSPFIEMGSSDRTQSIKPSFKEVLPFLVSKLDARLSDDEAIDETTREALLKHVEFVCATLLSKSSSWEDNEAGKHDATVLSELEVKDLVFDTEGHTSLKPAARDLSTSSEVVRTSRKSNSARSFDGRPTFKNLAIRSSSHNELATIAQLYQRTASPTSEGYMHSLHEPATPDKHKERVMTEIKQELSHPTLTTHVSQGSQGNDNEIISFPSRHQAPHSQLTAEFGSTADDRRVAPNASTLYDGIALPFPSRRQTDSTRQGPTAFSSVSDNVKRFYTTCYYVIGYARKFDPVQVDCSGPQATRETLGHVVPQQQTESISQKRQRESDLPSSEPNEENQAHVSTAKRSKHMDQHAYEWPCWWYMRDPERNVDCARNCSKGRTLHSYRRHHLEEHWKWGDAESQGITLADWTAAKHATCRRPQALSYEKDSEVWTRTYRLLWGLKEDDPIPDPICYEEGHVHVKAKKPYVQSLPTRRDAGDREVPAAALDDGRISKPVDWGDQLNAPSSFLTSSDTRPSSSSCLLMDARDFFDPNTIDVGSNWDGRSRKGLELLAQCLNPNALNDLVMHHVFNMSEQLLAMMRDPGSINCGTIRQICYSAIDFETSFSRAIMATQASIQPTLPQTSQLHRESYPVMSNQEALPPLTLTMPEPVPAPDYSSTSASDDYTSNGEEVEGLIPNTPDTFTNQYSDVEEIDTTSRKGKQPATGQQFDISDQTYLDHLGDSLSWLFG